MGGTPSRSEASYYTNGVNPWVSVRELNGGYIYDTKEKITDTAVKESSVKLYPKDTVLFSFKLSIGKTAIAGVPMYSNEAIVGINTLNSDEVTNKYLYYYLTVTDFSGMGRGAISNGSMNKQTVKQIQIPTPPRVIQQKIVEYCDKIEEKIARLKQEAELDKAIAAELFMPVVKEKVKEEDKESLPEEITEIVDGFEKMTITSLKQIAKELKIPRFSTFKASDKSTLIELIRAKK
jgi:restriction endonuclease S subunit